MEVNTIGDVPLGGIPDVSHAIGMTGSERQENFKEKRDLIIKLAILVLFPVVMICAGAFVGSKYLADRSYMIASGVLLSAPMRMENWQGFGVVFDPVISVPVKTVEGFENNDFLLDSGALVSSLPREWADKLGVDLAFLPRTTFLGFGGKTSLAYQGEMTVKLGNNLEKIPVVFTEAAGTKSLLGRKGFFESYSVYFNHKDQTIEIRE